MPIFAQQSGYLLQASGALCKMLDTVDPSQWRRLEKEIKACEVQGDAILTELHEQLSERLALYLRRPEHSPAYR